MASSASGTRSATDPAFFFYVLLKDRILNGKKDVYKQPDSPEWRGYLSLQTSIRNDIFRATRTYPLFPHVNFRLVSTQEVRDPKWG